MNIVLRQLGLQDYEPCFVAMRDFTDARDADTPDEIWLLQHRPVFTQGQAGKAEHLLDLGDIPLVQADRGGQVTYHGPGQITVYLLIDIKRRALGVRALVTAMEEAIVDTLATYAITALPRADAPGVYVGQQKIASLGLRVRRGCSYHGLALNVAMDKTPWARINPCGLGVPVTQMADHMAQPPEIDEVMPRLVDNLTHKLGYNSTLHVDTLP